MGLLARTIDDGYWVDGEGRSEELAPSLRARLTMDLVTERRTIQISEALRDAGVRHVVFKGAAHAHLFEADPGLRHFDDVDVVIPGADLVRAYEIVTSLGGRRLYPEPRPGFDVRFGKGATFATPNHGAVDVHRMVATGWAGAALERAELFNDLSEVGIAGATLPVFGPLRCALVCAVRAVVGDQHVEARVLRDAVLAWSRPEVDRGELIGLACDVGMGAVLAAAVELATTRLALDDDGVLHPWAMQYRPTRSELVNLAPYTAEHWSYPRQLANQARGIDSFGGTVRFLHAVVLPAKGSGRAPIRQRMRSGMRSLVGK